MKKILLIHIFLLTLVPTFGQEMLGVINSNYSGIFNIGINPSSMTTSRLYMDVNLISVQTFLNNNYIFWTRDDMKNYLSSRELPVYYTDENEERNYNIYRDNINKKGYQVNKIIGPSAMLVYNRHAFGLTTALRTISSFNELPNEMAIFLYEAIDYDYQHDIRYTHETPIRGASISWAELGLSYAYTFHRYRWNFWSAGISVKPLFGLSGMFLRLDNVDYLVHNDDSASVYNSAFQYGYSLPVDYETNDYDPKPLVKGFGLAVDVGITFQKTIKGHSTVFYSSLCEQPFEDYNYRIGLSVMDLGFIRFSRKAELHTYYDAHTEWYKPHDTLPSGSIDNINAKVNQFFGNSNSGYTFDDQLKLNLPTIASLQADFNMEHGLYLGGIVDQPLAFSANRIYRPAILAFIPRYETPRLEFTLPLSIYDYDFTKLNIGFMVRFGNFFFGCDKLNSYIGARDVTGLDFYAGFRLNLSKTFGLNFLKGVCGSLNPWNIEMFDYRNF